VDLQAASYDPEALLHTQHTKARPLAGSLQGSRHIKPHTVVTDTKREAAIVLSHFDPDVSRPGVSRHIGQRFLYDTKARGLDGSMGTWFQSIRRKVHDKPGSLPLPFHIPV
jgi:hypothetical protein